MQQISSNTSSSDLYATGRGLDVSLNKNVPDNVRCFIHFKLIDGRPKVDYGHFFPHNF
jgi:hypothetical protein